MSLLEELELMVKASDNLFDKDHDYWYTPHWHIWSFVDQLKLLPDAALAELEAEIERQKKSQSASFETN